MRTTCRQDGNIGLRPIEAHDSDFLRRVYASTRAEELAPLGWPAVQLDAFLAQQFEAQRCDYWNRCDTTRFCIITFDGTDAGRLYVERRSDTLHVVDIALLPDYRGRGIGGFLFAQLFDEADEGGLAVRIHVEQDNPAQRLYLRLGFGFIEESHGIYRLMERPSRTTAPA